jgi:uncharacterized sulfatase
MNSDSMGAMRRRTFLGGALGCGPVLGAPSPDAPNVVLIISDDQGWGDYGFMGHPHIRTPRLDKLARGSVVFTRGYSTAPLCCPSLASMLTGLHPHQSGITSNDPPRTGDSPWPPERLALRARMIDYHEKSPTLPRLLAQRGYRSFQAGKWWGGHYSRGGFTSGMTHGDPARGGRHGDEGLKIGRAGLQPVYDFLDGAAGHPFFLWFAPMMPHTPHNPPGRLLKHYRTKTPSIHVARYWAMCEWWDEVCGQLLDRLEAKGLAGNTLVLYTCDNGWIQRPDAPGFAPRSKRSQYDGGVRTPLMVHWPARAKPTRDERTLASNIDLAPTILRAAGLGPGADMQGANLLDAGALKRRDIVFGGVYTHDAVDIGRPAASLQHLWAVEGHWKLILPGPQAEGKPEVELFNAGEDPHETNNLAARHPEHVARLRQRIARWWPEGAAAIRKA